MIESIVKNCLITRPSLPAVAGTSAITGGDIIDLASASEGCFDSVCFVALLGTVTNGSVVTLKANYGDESDLSDGAYKTTTATVTGTGTSAFADNNLLILDVVKPGKRYVRADLTRATANCVLDSIVAVRYNARNVPTGTVATIADAEISVA